MEKEQATKKALYDFVNTINKNYAVIEEHYSIPNILVTWEYKLNEIKKIYQEANLDLNDSITGSIVLRYADKIIQQGLTSLITFGKKVKVLLPDGRLKAHIQKKLYIKNKNLLDKYKEFNDTIKSINIRDELTDYIYLYAIILSKDSDNYTDEEITELINMIKSELTMLKIKYDESMMTNIYNMLRSEQYGTVLSKKQ